MTKANNSQTKSIANVGVIHFLLTVTGVVQAILIGRIFGISRPIEIYFFTGPSLGCFKLAR